MIDLNEIKSRINQVYQDVLGAESHERKMLCDEIERLTKLVSAYKTITTSHEKQICALTEALDALRGADKTLDSEREANALLTEQLSAAASEILALRAANKECVEYFNEMKKDLAAANTEIERIEFSLQRSDMECVCAKREAAASQAREQQLRESLQFCADNYYNMAGEATRAKETLALPQDTSALEAMVQKAGEVMRERCFGECDAGDLKWQPIETAPKDKDILLFCPRLGVVRGCWNDCKYHKNSKPYWTNDRADIFGVRYTKSDQPTHWMPLPDAPGDLK